MSNPDEDEELSRLVRIVREAQCAVDAQAPSVTRLQCCIESLKPYSEKNNGARELLGDLELKYTLTTGRSYQSSESTPDDLIRAEAIDKFKIMTGVGATRN